MKIFKKLGIVLLAAVLAMTSFVLTACNGGDSNDSGNNDASTAVYQVKVLDAQGNPCTSGVIVKFLKDGKQVAMIPVNDKGIVEKEMDKGDYTVELLFTDEENSAQYDKNEAVLTSEKTSVEISLMNGVSGEATVLNATSPVTGERKDYEAYNVNSGKTTVALEAKERNYFLFVPSEAGTYEISVNNADASVGYYGSPYFVLAESVEEVVDNKFTISVSKSNIGTAEGGTAVYVIGVDGLDEASEVVLSVERIGDPEYNISDEPWTQYQITCEITPFTLDLPDGKDLTYVDIEGDTEDYEIVFNDADGYYHLGTADGPVMYVHLGKGAPYVSLYTVINGDGAAGGAPIRSYFFDENGEFVKREDYTDILSTYFVNMDQTKYVYPLNDDLIYIIKNGCSGWWDPTSPDYIFDECNPEIGWMFACCYVK